jgi:hypothetical protein
MNTNKKTFIFFLGICGVALVTRIFLIKLNISPWWDPAIYVGMGKYLFSGGTIGLWEILRPPLWPTLLGAFWYTGFDPLMAAKYLAALFGLGTMVLIYRTGEKQEEGLGLAAALMLAASPAYALFVAIPTNDIAAAFLAFVASYFILRERYMRAGIFVALAFLTRFPHGLFLVVFGLFILAETWRHQNFKAYVYECLKKVGFLAFGFGLLAIPYLILNYINYHDPLLPLKLGREVIEGDPTGNGLYYIQYLIVDTPVLIFALVGSVVYFYNLIKTKKRPPALLTLSILATIIVGGYFSHLGHKELRYAFAFLPYLALLAGYGVACIWNLFPQVQARYIVLGIICVIAFGNLWIQARHQYVIPLSEARAKYYKLLPAHSLAITSSPQVMLGSNAKIVGVFDTWENGNRELGENPDLEYVAIDSCQVACTTSAEECENQKTTFLSAIHDSHSIVYKGFDNACLLTIYELTPFLKAQ